MPCLGKTKGGKNSGLLPLIPPGGVLIDARQMRPHDMQQHAMPILASG
jgi:hypothetical protein